MIANMLWFAAGCAAGMVLMALLVSGDDRRLR